MENNTPNNKIEDIGQKVIDVLNGIFDPEIPVSIYDLGLIYDVQIDPKNFDTKIIMTLTSPSCPVAESLPVEVEKKVEKVEGINKVTVEITWDPPWDKEYMTEEARFHLDML